MVELSFESNKIGYSLIPYKQCKEYPSVSLMNDLEKCAFNEVISSLNLTIQNDELLECKYNDFCNEMSVEWLFNLEPYKRNRLFQALFRRGYLPSFFTKGKAKWLINFIECESQVTRLLSALKSKLQ
jgi:poly-gamma-glutamate synthesis protein (capsule biosynthesis protein)